MNEKRHHEIVRACEQDLFEHGDTFRGVGWTKKPEYADLRYRIMLDCVRRPTEGRVTLLDLGCGTSQLKRKIEEQGMDFVDYAGLDLSQAYLDVSRAKYPSTTYYMGDILDADFEVPVHDYVIMNGLFNFRGSMSHEEMWDYMQAMLKQAYAMCSVGMAFNVMSKYLDWEREDLFHLPLDTLAGFLDKKIGRNFTMRHDYGLFEYTTYVYRTPLHSEA